MFCDVLRREGHPVLWYLILKAAMFLHLPYQAIHLLSGGIAATGAWLLLAKSPFPKWLAALLPFTYFLDYQYAAICVINALLAAALVVRDGGVGRQEMAVADPLEPLFALDRERVRSRIRRRRAA